MEKKEFIQADIKWLGGSSLPQTLNFPRYGNSKRAKTAADFLCQLSNALVETGMKEEMLAPKTFSDTVMLLPHQITTAYNAIHKMNCRALLADEVGLGKTIEAGIVLKELILRNWVNHVLILVPPPLVYQWMDELMDKFNLKTQIPNYPEIPEGICIESEARGIRHINQLGKSDFDFLIVDEAHHMKNHLTKRYKLIKAINPKHLLLLTATPLQNSLREFFNIMNLLKPGIFGTWGEFQHAYIISGTKDRKIKKGKVEELNGILREVMVRHRKTQVGLETTGRTVKKVTFVSDDREKIAYETISRDLKEFFSSNVFFVIMILKELSSSPSTIVDAIETNRLSSAKEFPHVIEDWLPLLKSYTPVKQKGLIKEIQRIKTTDKDAKIVVFCEYRNAIFELNAALKEQYTCYQFTGGLTPLEKEEVKNNFKKDGDVMLCTSAATEGLNLQFANFLINYDLPWNPMKIEQRIGRIHRIGQKKPVYVFNFVVQDTLEDHIVSILYDKIGLFKTLVGDMATILSETQLDGSFETEILKAYLTAENNQKLNENLTKLAWKVADAKKVHEQLNLFNKEVFEGFDLGV